MIIARVLWLGQWMSIRDDFSVVPDRAEGAAEAQDIRLTIDANPMPTYLPRMASIARKIRESGGEVVTYEPPELPGVVH